MAGTMGSMLRSVRLSHFSRAVAFGAVVALGLVSATALPRAQASSSTFLVFFRSTPVGNEQVAVEKGVNGWSITSSGRVGAPFDLIVRGLQARYDTDWKPLELTLDATLRGQSATVHTVVNGTTAQTET